MVSLSAPSIYYKWVRTKILSTSIYNSFINTTKAVITLDQNALFEMNKSILDLKF